MRDFETTLGDIRIQGQIDRAYAPVVDAFIDNFREREEVGASLCISVGHQVVVDLWGGFADAERTRQWTQDTIAVVFSCTKAATALCANILLERGQLELHAPVARYWPEFARNGKEHVTVAMMLNHTAGVPAFREPIKAGGYYDWDYMVQRLGDEEPFWEPGTRNGYHMMTFGWTVGELVRRASGKSLGTFFRDEVAAPLGLDFWIGLPEVHEPRVAGMVAWRPKRGEPASEFTRALQSDWKSLQGLALLNSGGHNAGSREAHAAELGGGGGITNARALEGMYRPLANRGRHAGGTFLQPATITRMSQVSVATPRDATLLIGTRFGLGFMKSMDNRHLQLDGGPQGIDSALLGEKAFGHVGAGGSIGFADPECELAFGYVMNRMGAGILLNPRGQALVDETYRMLGYRTNAPGVWA